MKKIDFSNVLESFGIFVIALLFLILMWIGAIWTSGGISTIEQGMWSSDEIEERME